ncbi:hypothetical protein EZV73_13630 [Acidaminobacter sp. JC074]|uniref:M14 family zinc carboxypeptidase n=1 Tax=Acidaminobacter sp. JC074 TaxID=2530199 RepID=UPI001F0D3EB3|nr:M14 family zinc carboxypeptidase [Acidaminobacter sp. JC074]MCH4888628.1 hypothetical protein [Acidaminobacter sp. JC074]
MRKIIAIFLLVLSSVTFAEDIDKLYTAETLYDQVISLENKYPEIIKVVHLGQSTDGRPIYAVVMTENVHITMRVSEGYVEKMHFLVESGIHSRENPGPNLMVKMIEDYAKDYYDDSVIEDYNLKELLSSNVLHIIPLSNPDGYNLSNRGLYTISKENQNLLLSFRDQDFRNYKSNIRGVDLNRNFPGYYYDVDLERWRDIWNMIHNEYTSYRPGGAFYFGTHAGSEVETKLMMDYFLDYDFRNYLSFHSKGEVIYYDKWMLSDNHNKHASNLAYKIALETGYDMVASSRYTSSSGYSTDFVAMNTLKPSLTVETVHWKQTLPVTTSVVNRAYDQVKHVPLIAMKEGNRVGYFDYKWYLDGRYVRDFEDQVYAKAFYDEYGGMVLKYEGRPRLFLNENMNKVTRLEMIQEVMALVSDKVVPGQAYLDCDDLSVRKARTLGIISDQDYFRPDDYATHEETYVVLKQAFYDDYVLSNDHQVNIRAFWAVEAIKILHENNIIDYDRLLVGRITLGELRGYLVIINQLLEGV